MAQKLTCLVTLHGIGFQHPPQGTTPGYADGLHAHLHAPDALGDLLGDDPNRKPGDPGGTGAVYVSSNWPPENNRGTYAPRGPGLWRLGTWKNEDRDDIDHSDPKQRLVSGDQPIAHVALVYTNLEGVGLHAAALAETAAKATFSLHHYTSLVGAMGLLLRDTVATIKGDVATMRAHDGTSTSLMPRRALDPSARHRFFDLLHPRSGGPQDSSGPLAVFDTIQDDIATYVCRNDIREDVRLFVAEALQRLCARDDVARVVINAHSQGTVVAYDVLRALPSSDIAQIGAFVTAGSPLRKYLDCFTWGNEAGCIAKIEGADEKGAPAPGYGWVSFWDETDPVADPLSPNQDWRPGEAVPRPPNPYKGLFYAHDDNTGELLKLAIADRKVDNWKNSTGGGLQSHNYWDNQTEFVVPLAGILRAVSGR